MVIGGTHGIGLAIAEEVAYGGAQVTVTGRDADRARAAEARLGPGSTAIVGDVTDHEHLASLAARAGDLDALFVNVGIAEPDAGLDEADEFERFMAANTTIHLGIVRAAGNGRATQIVERLLDDSERARRVALQCGAADGTARAREELRCVLAALGSRDGERAAELLAAAIKAFREDLSEALGRAVLDAPVPVAPPAAPDAT